MYAAVSLWVWVGQSFSKVLMKGYSTLDPRYWYEAIKLFKGELRTMCSDSLLESPELVKIINEKRKVDAVVMLGTCASFLGHALDSPLITFSPAGPFSLHLTPGLGNPINPIIHPNVVAPFKQCKTNDDHLDTDLTILSLLKPIGNRFTSKNTKQIH